MTEGKSTSLNLGWNKSQYLGHWWLNFLHWFPFSEFVKNAHVTQLGGDAEPWLYNVSDSQGTNRFDPIQNASFSVTDAGYTIIPRQYIREPGVMNLTSTVSPHA